MCSTHVCSNGYRSLDIIPDFHTRAYKTFDNEKRAKCDLYHSSSWKKSGEKSKRLEERQHELMLAKKYFTVHDLSMFLLANNEVQRANNFWTSPQNDYQENSGQDLRNRITSSIKTTTSCCKTKKKCISSSGGNRDYYHNRDDALDQNYNTHQYYYPLIKNNTSFDNTSREAPADSNSPFPFFTTGLPRDLTKSPTPHGAAKLQDLFPISPPPPSNTNIEVSSLLPSPPAILFGAQVFNDNVRPNVVINNNHHVITPKKQFKVDQVKLENETFFSFPAQIIPDIPKIPECRGGEPKLVVDLLRSNHNSNIKSREFSKPNFAIPLTPTMTTENIDCQIRNAKPEEIIPICHWRATEFGYGAHWDFLRILHKCYPEGWFVAIDRDNDIIGNIFGMNLSDNVAFGGLFCVKKPYRCQGIGGKLWNRRKEFIGPTRNFGVNAVESRISPNQKLGMYVSFTMNRFRGIMSPEVLQMIRKLSVPYQLTVNCIGSNINKSIIPSNLRYIIIESPIPIGQIENHTECTDDPEHTLDIIPKDLLIEMITLYDESVHTLPRYQFVRELLGVPETTTIVCVETEAEYREGQRSSNFREYVKIRGYGVLRPRYKGYTIGPIYADTPDIGMSIFFDLLLRVPTDNIFDFMTIEQKETAPRDNMSSLIDDTTQMKMTSIPEFIKLLPDIHKECTLYRMYKNEDIQLPFEKIYCMLSSVAFLC